MSLINPTFIITSSLSYIKLVFNYYKLHCVHPFKPKEKFVLSPAT